MFFTSVSLRGDVIFESYAGSGATGKNVERSFFVVAVCLENEGRVRQLELSSQRAARHGLRGKEHFEKS